MKPMTKSTLTLAALIAMLCCASSAFAASNAVIRDCVNDGSVGGHYSQGQYKDALNNIPSDVNEYTDCRTVIAQAQAKAAQDDHSSKGGAGAGSSGGSGGGGSAPAKLRDLNKDGRVDAKDRAVAAARKKAGKRATGTTAAATPASSTASDDGGGFPTWLLILLIVLGLGGAAAAYLALRDRANARRET